MQRKIAIIITIVVCSCGGRVKNADQNSHARHIQLKNDPGVYLYFQRFDEVSNTGGRFSLEKMNGRDLICKISADSIVWGASDRRWKLSNCFIHRIVGKKETVEHYPVLDTDLNFGPEVLKQ